MIRFIISRILMLLATALLALAWTKSATSTVSVVTGTALGLINHEGLRWGVKKLISMVRAEIVIVLLNMLRIGAFFIISGVLLYHRVVQFKGFVIGVTVVYIIIIVEGLYRSKYGYSEGR